MALRDAGSTCASKALSLESRIFAGLFQVDSSPTGMEPGILPNMTDLNSLPLINDKSSRQFELEVEGRMAKLEYELNGTKMFLTHASVPKALSGTGVGAALVEKVFAYIEENNLKLVPMCSFVTAHLRKHPEWKRIVEKGVEV